MVARVPHVWLQYPNESACLLQVKHGQKCTMGVSASASQLARIIEPVFVKNLFGQQYHVRETETQLLQQSFAGLAAALFQWNDRKIFCNVCPLSMFVLKHDLGSLAFLCPATMTGKLIWLKTSSQKMPCKHHPPSIVVLKSVGEEP